MSRRRAPAAAAGLLLAAAACAPLPPRPAVDAGHPAAPGAIAAALPGPSDTLRMPTPTAAAAGSAAPASPMRRHR